MKKNIKYIGLLILICFSLLVPVGCTASDPWTDDFYAKTIYTYNGTAWNIVQGGGVLAEVDPVFTASPAHGITALNISSWNNHPTLTTGVHGVGTGDVVGTTLTQELTNKTLTSAVGKGTWTASGTWVLPAHQINGTLDMNTHYITNVINPVNNQDVATKLYVDSSVSGNVSLYVPYNGAAANVDFNAKQITNGTLNAMVLMGTFTASGTVVLPAITMGGTLNLNDNIVNNIKKINFTDPTLLTISSGIITITQGYHTVDTEGATSYDYLDTINGGSVGDELILAAASDLRMVEITRNGNIRFQPNDLIEGFTFSSPSGSSGTFYTGGYYDAPASSVTLTNASLTQTYGSATSPYGAHAFLVAGAAGTTNAGTVSIVVSGVSVDDEGVRNPTDSETIVASITTMATNSYYETTKVWVGTVTYTLTPAGGATTFSCVFNYGLAAYDSFGESNFYITTFEIMGRAGANDNNFDVQLLHHQATGWTYSAAAFSAGTTPICSLATDYGVDNDLVTNQRFKYERDMDVAISGTSTGILKNEGFLVRVITSANKAVEFMNISVYATVVHNSLHLRGTGQSYRFVYNGTYWMQQ